MKEERKTASHHLLLPGRAWLDQAPQNCLHVLLPPLVGVQRESQRRYELRLHHVHRPLAFHLRRRRRRRRGRRGSLLRRPLVEIDRPLLPRKIEDILNPVKALP